MFVATALRIRIDAMRYDFWVGAINGPSHHSVDSAGADHGE